MEGDLMCQFSNSQEEDVELLKKEIFVESKPSLKFQQNPNPNTPIRIVRKIYEGHHELIKNVFNVLMYLNNYKQTLSIHRTIKELFKKYVGQHTLTPQQLNHKLNENREEIVHIIWQHMVKKKEEIDPQEMTQVENFFMEKPALRIFKVNLMKTDPETQFIRSCMSKLKVMVLKAMYRESTNLQYLIQCYTANLRSALNNHSLKYFQEEKSQKKYQLIDLYFSRHQFIYLALTSLKNRLDVISLSQLKDCKIAPHEYLSALRKRGYLAEEPVFFVNFYTEPLLFIDGEYTNFDGSLLYCLVVARGVTVSLSDIYLSKLSSVCESWSRQQLLIEFYHPHTSSSIPLYFSFISERIQDEKNSLVCDDLGGKHYRNKTEIQNFNKMLNNILKIRKFVFVKLLYHWLSKIFGANDENVIEIDILGKFKAVIRVVTQPICYDSEKRQPKQRLEIMTNFLMLAANPSNSSFSRQYLKEKIYANFQASLIKIVAEETGYKVSWPMEAGSMGHYYYDYNKEKVLSRRQINYFLNTF